MQTLTLAKALSGVVFGTVEMDPTEYAYLNGLFKENAKTLNNHLKQKEWICGTEKPTIADYQLAIAEIELQQCVMETQLKISLNHMNDHFKRVTSLPEFQKRFGIIKPGKKNVAPRFAEEKKEKPASNNKGKGKK